MKDLIRKPQKPNPLEDGYKPLSVFQQLIFQIGGYSHQYANSCWKCGEQTQGNKITGYYFPCRHFPDSGLSGLFDSRNWRDGRGHELPIVHILRGMLLLGTFATWLFIFWILGL